MRADLLDSALYQGLLADAAAESGEVVRLHHDACWLWRRLSAVW